MEAAVIVFPGSNCDQDMVYAITKISGKKPHIIWHKDTLIPKNIDLICLPGGFSYGDYLRCGAIAAKSPIMQEVIKRAEDGAYILGVCNGFQILTESGLLPGALRCNKHLKFIDQVTTIKITAHDNEFFSSYDKNQIINLPIAHHDGCYTASEETLSMLEAEGRIALKYANSEGDISEKYSINGAAKNIAGIFSKNYRVLGMMPHPERAVDSRTKLTDGIKLFENLLK